MKKIITYGTFDMLHYGHLNLLKNARQLGDYLVVAVTSDDFDKARGKINVQQSLEERIEGVRNTGLADKIIIEEYEGQKIDDIRRYDIDVFTVGSDWKGQFDYLKEYCDVVYLTRTEGISSSEIREKIRTVQFGMVGDSLFLNRVAMESYYVNGLKLTGICTENIEKMSDKVKQLPLVTKDYDELLASSDVIYIHSHPKKHFVQIKKALEKGKHVLCESPIALSRNECETLYDIAQKNGCVLLDGLRTAYATAYYRLLLLIKGGKIGKVVSVDATCTSLVDISKYDKGQLENLWNSITSWGPTALLPIFQILGTDYQKKQMVTHIANDEVLYDTFTKISFVYKDAVASVKVGTGVKSEGELIISGTKGYIYVPAPWWKTDYFEIRYENPADNKRCFYQLEGEGIRYELATFIKAVERKKMEPYINKETSIAIAGIMEDFVEKRDVIFI